MSNKSKVADTFIKYRNRLMRAVSAIVDVDDIEDIVQDAFVKSYEAELKQEISYERTYMMRTVKNLAINHVSKAAYKQNDLIDNMDALPDEILGYSLEKDIESKERFLNFCRAADNLTPDVKRVFLLKKVYGLKQAEIAEMLDLSESTVEKHVAKGLMLCAQHLARVGHPNKAQKTHKQLG